MNQYGTIKLKYVADVFNGNSIPDDEKDNYVDKVIPYIPTKELRLEDGSINYDNGLSVNLEDGFRIAPENSVLMCIEGGSAGRKIGRTDRPVAFVNKLCCFDGKRISSQLLYYCLKSVDFTEQFFLNMTGMIGGVNVSVLKNLFISFPLDKAQQNLVVRYLDEKCKIVDELLANLKDQIETLKCFKKAIITEKVTKGLDSQVALKDSQYEWIGCIPFHWAISRKLSYQVNDDISYGIVKLFEPDDINGVKVIRCSDVLEGMIDTHNIRTVTQEISQEYKRTLLRGGEVLVNVRGTLGGCSVVPSEMRGYNIAREVAKITPKETLHNRYAMYYLLSNAFTDYRTRYLSGSVYIGLNIELLSSCPIPIPPIEEQIAICDALDGECKTINHLIAIKEKKIQKLDDYKKSLIYEYVTGKKEV